MYATQWRAPEVEGTIVVSVSPATFPLSGLTCIVVGMNWLEPELFQGPLYGPAACVQGQASLGGGVLYLRLVQIVAVNKVLYIPVPVCIRLGSSSDRLRERTGRLGVHTRCS